jgi:hypothetical protein
VSKKYEIKVIQGMNGYINDRLIKEQDNGWEIAGEILIRKRKIAEDAYLYIPLKREIQNKPE